MSLTFVLWGVFALFFLGVPCIYYLYMKRRARDSWKLEFDENYQPFLSILVPMHNEEEIICYKLENLYKVEYPSEKLQVILVNDSSTDKTLDEVNKFLSSHHGLDMTVFNSVGRRGKADCLNFALKHATGEIIVISDADCFWPSDILLKAMPYLSDPHVAAVAGRELLLNNQQSWVTEGELAYNNFVQSVRLGESKVHSTVFFQGGFGAYNRAALEEFDCETDDSGTALNIVQKKGRTLIIPDALFYTMFPASWKNKVTIKLRRAAQLQRIWIKSLKLLIKGELVLPKKIAIPEILLHLFNPIFFVALLFATALLFVEHPVLLLAFSAILLPILLVQKTRVSLIELVQNNLILLAALSTSILNKQFRLWSTVKESRSLLNGDVLKKLHLI